MKLIIDIGNTSINLAIFDGKILTKKASTKEKELYSIEYFSSFVGEFVNKLQISNVYLSSVVPSVTNLVKGGIDNILPLADIYTITNKSKTNMEYHVDNPSEIGSDICVDLAIGKEKYGYPLLIADLGTASKVLYIDEKGNFSACNIIPGLTLSLRTLTQNAALLPDVHVQVCNTVIAKNTIDAMNSGVIYAHLGGIDNIFNEYERELGFKCKKVVTGGCAMKLRNLLNPEYILDEDFLLEGINFLGDLGNLK